MAHLHSHEHAHGHHYAVTQLRIAFLLTLAILLLEAAVGYASNSLALLADAGHILTDAFALGLAWFAANVSSKPADERNTFGYRRSGILAALVNAALLIVVALATAAEASLRIRQPEHVSAGLVIVAAIIAIAINGYIATALRRHGDDNLNVRAAMVHILGDMAASAGVVLAGVLIVVWHLYLADPIMSLCIAALIGFGAWQIVRDTVSILMEAAPADIDLDAVQHAMLEVPGVQDVHDLHVWALSDGFRLLSAHVSLPDQSLADTANLLSDIKLILHRRFHIEHATIETECIDCRTPRARPIQLFSSEEERSRDAR